jgi:hypothetical protein
MNEEYVIFSFTYRNDRASPSTVLGVHGAASLVSKDGVRRPGIRPILGVDNLTYHVEAEPDFVTLFSSPLPFESTSGRYAPPARWHGLRYLAQLASGNVF